MLARLLVLGCVGLEGAAGAVAAVDAAGAAAAHVAVVAILVAAAAIVAAAADDDDDDDDDTAASCFMLHASCFVLHVSHACLPLLLLLPPPSSTVLTYRWLRRPHRAAATRAVYEAAKTVGTVTLEPVPSLPPATRCPVSTYAPAMRCLLSTYAPAYELCSTAMRGAVLTRAVWYGPRYAATRFPVLRWSKLLKTSPPCCYASPTRSRYCVSLCGYTSPIYGYASCEVWYCMLLPMSVLGCYGLPRRCPVLTSRVPGTVLSDLSAQRRAEIGDMELLQQRTRKNCADVYPGRFFIPLLYTAESKT
eukprot:1671763-Rhodomonas_salina.3